MPTKPRVYVANPEFTPLPFGLLSSLKLFTRTPDDEHWRMGVNYEPICAQGGSTYDMCFAVSGTGAAPVSAPTAKTATTTIGRRGATSFTVYARVDCSAPGFWEQSNMVADRALTQSEQWQVENAFWTGLAGGQSVVFPHLAANAEIVDNGIILQTSATIVSGGVTAALDPVEALGFLEAELANCYDGVGVIHAPRVLLPAMANADILIRENDYYRTSGGNIIVFGAGYTGSSPSGSTASGSVWMYATGAMFVYQSSSQILSVLPERGRGYNSFDPSSNSVGAISERTYVIGWDCCHLAVNVSTGGMEAGVVYTSG